MKIPGVIKLRSVRSIRASVAATVRDYIPTAGTLMAGTVVAQAIPFALAPILTRLFGPSAFGVLTVFLAALDLLSVGIAGRYELAVLAALVEDEAERIVGVAVGVSALGAVVLTAVLACIVRWTSGSFVPVGMADWLPLLPLALASFGCFQATTYWLIRNRQFRSVATIRVARSVLIYGSHLAVGLFISRSGRALINATIVAQLVAAVIAIAVASRLGLRIADRTVRELLSTARRYRSFPLFSVPGAVTNSVGAQLPVLLLSPSYGAAVIGQLGIAQRMVAAPMAIVAQSFADAYSERASRETREAGNHRSAWRRAAIVLGPAAVGVGILLWLLSPTVLPLVLGSQWRLSGEICRALTPYLVAAFIANPLSRTFAVVEKMGVYFWWQAAMTSSVAIALLLSRRAQNPLTPIWAYSITYAAAYVANIFLSHRHAARSRVVAV